MPRTYSVERIEQRIPMTVAIHLSGRGKMPGVETTFTENVSSHGARVSTVRLWRTNEVLEVASLPGDFHAFARVAYCESQPGGFVIGLEFLEPAGRWVVGTPAVSGKPLQG